MMRDRRFFWVWKFNKLVFMIFLARPFYKDEETQGLLWQGRLVLRIWVRSAGPSGRL